MAASHRVSLTLDPADEAVLARFTDPERAEHAALAAWAAEHNLAVRDSSDAAVLRVLVRAGAEALLERALEAGYARLAAEMTDEDRAERRTLLAHYADRIDSRYAE
jgi:hypothetical protein